MHPDSFMLTQPAREGDKQKSSRKARNWCQSHRTAPQESGPRHTRRYTHTCSRLALQPAPIGQVAKKLGYQHWAKAKSSGECSECKRTARCAELAGGAVGGRRISAWRVQAEQLVLGERTSDATYNDLSSMSLLVRGWNQHPDAEAVTTKKRSLSLSLGHASKREWTTTSANILCHTMRDTTMIGRCVRGRYKTAHTSHAYTQGPP